MKRLLAILLALSMIFSLVACASERESGDSGKANADDKDSLSDADDAPVDQDDESSGGDDDDEDDEDEYDDDEDDVYYQPDGESPLFLNAFNPLLGDTFALDVDLSVTGMIDIRVEMYRDIDDVYIYLDANGNKVKLIVVDGVLYFFNEEDKTYFSKELNQAEAEKLLSGFKFAEAMAGSTAEFEGMELIDTGKGRFGGKGYYFEETEDEFGNLTRFYYDYTGSMVGMSMSAIEVPFFISYYVPANAFDIPDGYNETNPDLSFVDKTNDLLNSLFANN